MVKMIEFFLSIEEEEKWLNEMSEKGYRFVEKEWFSYVLEENTTGETYHYYVDERGFEKDNQEFQEFLEGLNIKLVQKQFGHYYFETTEENMGDYIYTDKNSKIKLYLRCILTWVFVAVLNISILHDARGPYLLNVSIPVALNSVILVCAFVKIMNYTRLIFKLYCKEMQRISRKM